MDSYVHSILSAVIVQLAQSTDTSIIHPPALETLALCLSRYIHEIGLRLKRITIHSERSESNFHDIMASLSSLGVGPYHLTKFLKRSNLQVFSHHIPTFPNPSKIFLELNAVAQSRKVSSISLANDSNQESSFVNNLLPLKSDQLPSLELENLPPTKSYIPDFFPSLPPLSSFSHSPLFSNPIIEPSQVKKIHSNDSVKVRNAIRNLFPVDSIFFKLLNTMKPLEFPIPTNFNQEILNAVPLLSDAISQILSPNIGEIDLNDPDSKPIPSNFPGPELFCFTSITGSILDYPMDSLFIEKLEMPVTAAQPPPEPQPDEANNAKRMRQMLRKIENSTENDKID
ncbi:hypothetical protein RCL1_004446 [Eukaryota sp. TZLM3-RCL]